MIKRFHSQQAHTKYRPYQSRWRRFLNYRKKIKKQKYTIKKQEKLSQQNPYKARRMEKRKLPLTKIKILLLLLFIIAWIILLLYLPFFQINQITYNGLENIKEAEIQDTINNKFLKDSNKIPYKNFFIIKPTKISEELEKNFPIQSIEIKKIFPNKLEINIKEKYTSLIYDNGSDYFLMDNTGKLIKYLAKIGDNEFLTKIITSTSTSSTYPGEIITTTTSTTKLHRPNYIQIQQQFGKYPILYDIRNKQVSVGDPNLLPDNFISAIIEINNKLSGLGIGDINYYVLENVNSGVEIKTSNIWSIFMQPTQNIDTQLNNLKIILAENQPALYIDLRQQSRVYWK
ncbi:MAG: FtsQ-type POTRA domain-containing protein [bacterium]